MTTYTITRTNSKGETTQLTKTYDTRRKANNGLDRAQENSSKSSVLRLYEDGKEIEERNGLS